MSTFTFGGVGEHTLSLSVSLSDWEGSTVVSAHKDPLFNTRAHLIATKRGSNMEREGTKDHKTKPNRVWGASQRGIRVHRFCGTISMR